MKGSIKMLADGNGDFTKAMGLELDASAFGLGQRSQRYALLAENGTVGRQKLGKQPERNVCFGSGGCVDICWSRFVPAHSLPPHLGIMVSNGSFDTVRNFPYQHGMMIQPPRSTLIVSCVVSCQAGMVGFHIHHGMQRS